MNKVILMGRLTRDPDVRYSQGDNPMAIARYTLAVDRRFARRGEQGDQQSADFIGCVAFGKSGEFAEKYLHKGGFRPAVTPIKTESRYTPPMSLWKIRNLPRARMPLRRADTAPMHRREQEARRGTDHLRNPPLPQATDS